MSLPIPDRTLLQAVDILTLPHETHVDRQGAYLFTRQDPALIPALRNAIHSNVGGSGSGATTAHHTRGLIDANASELYRSIDRRIRRWILATGWIRTGPWPNPEQLLRTWHATYRGDTRAHEATLNGWIATLEDLLVDPPRRYPLNQECPQCHQRWVVIDHGTDGHPDLERMDALHVSEREPAHHSEIVCRNPACGARWDGVTGARALALAIDQRKARQEAS